MMEVTDTPVLWKILPKSGNFKVIPKHSFLLELIGCANGFDSSNHDYWPFRFMKTIATA